MTRDEIIERNRRVTEQFLSGTHSQDIRDIAVIEETVVSDVVCHGFPGGDPHDRESYKEFFRRFRQSFSEMDWKIYTLVADEEFVAARWQISATHSGEFAGIQPGGKRVTFDGMVLYRMDDGKIAETWLHINELRLLGQIGALQTIAA